MASPRAVRSTLVSQLAKLPDGGAREIQEEGARTLGSLAISAGLLSLVAGGLLAAAWLDGGIWGFFAAVVGAVAIALVGSVVRQVLRRRKFGRSVLVLAQAPLRLGERFDGKVRTGIPRGDATPAIRLRLECVRRWEEEHGMGEDRRTEHHREVLWSVEREVTAGYAAGPEGKVAVVVPVAFDLPADQPAATPDPSDGIAWELGLHAPLPGLDYRASFRLPVV